MTKLKKSIAIAIIMLITLSVAWYIGGQIESKRWEDNFVHFDSANINGELDYVRIGAHGVVFKLRGKENKFVFYPHTGMINDYKIFRLIAKNGDTIIKPQYSDTLRLIKNEKEYLYTFDQF